MIEAEVVTDVARLQALSPAWGDLLRRSHGDELMASPTWLLSWWRIFGARGGRRLQVVALRDGSRLVGLAPLLWRRLPASAAVARRLSPGCRCLELLGSGESEQDEICSDYIGVAAERGREQEVAEAFCRVAGSAKVKSWDVLKLSAMNGASPMPALLASALRRLGSVRHEVAGTAPYLRLPESWDALLSCLTPSTRYLVRRSLRAWERWAGEPPTLRTVRSVGELAAAAALLRDLHRQRWRAAGHQGAFASARFRAFHQLIMPELLARGALDLLWLSVHGEPVAALYNLLWRRRVLFYQAGRRVDLPSGVRAGLVIHLCAIRRAIEAGFLEYDFLGGASRFKTQLARELRPLHEIQVTRPSLSNRVACAALSLAGGLRPLLTRGVKRWKPPASRR